MLTGFALILAIFLVVRGQIGAPDRYHTYFKNVAGLRAGAAVVHEGYIDVGSVSDVDPMADESGMRFQVNLGNPEGLGHPSDSVAEISSISYCLPTPFRSVPVRRRHWRRGLKFSQ